MTKRTIEAPRPEPRETPERVFAYSGEPLRAFNSVGYMRTVWSADLNRAIELYLELIDETLRAYVRAGGERRWLRAWMARRGHPERQPIPVAVELALRELSRRAECCPEGYEAGVEYELDQFYGVE